jgi:CRISPR-associated protein Cas1
MHGRLIHRRVDQSTGTLAPAAEAQDASEPFAVRSVTMSSERLGAICKIDLLEGQDGGVIPVDYKRSTKPPGEVPTPERVQICLQALVLQDNGYSVPRAELYYAGSHERVVVWLTPELIKETLQALEEMKKVVADNIVPPVLEDSPKCPRCSLVSICLPDEVTYLRHNEAAGAAPPIGKPRRLVPSKPAGSPLHVALRGGSVGISGERLQIRERGELVSEVKLIDVSSLSVFGRVQVSTQALQALAERDIPVSYLSYGGWFYGQFTGTASKNITLRLQQYQVASDPAASLKLAREMVVGKILNSRVLLRRNSRPENPGALKELSRLAHLASQTGAMGSLLGLEGMAARVYFEAFPQMLKNSWAFDWTARNRRPPHDPINALLSLGYAILTRTMTAVVQGVGYDPYLGFYHQPKYGKPALALDLMEEFRPLIVDSTIITVLNTGEITHADFYQRGEAVNLSDNGRRAFLTALERRFDTEIEHPLFGYRLTYRRILEVQARLTGRFLSGEIPTYPAFRTR